MTIKSREERTAIAKEIYRGGGHSGGELGYREPPKTLAEAVERMAEAYGWQVGDTVIWDEDEYQVMSKAHDDDLGTIYGLLELAYLPMVHTKHLGEVLEAAGEIDENGFDGAGDAPIIMDADEASEMASLAAELQLRDGEIEYACQTDHDGGCPHNYFVRRRISDPYTDWDEDGADGEDTFAIHDVCECDCLQGDHDNYATTTIDGTDYYTFSVDEQGGWDPCNLPEDCHVSPEPIGPMH